MGLSPTHQESSWNLKKFATAGAWVGGGTGGEEQMTLSPGLNLTKTFEPHRHGKITSAAWEHRSDGGTMSYTCLPRDEGTKASEPGTHSRVDRETADCAHRDPRDTGQWKKESSMIPASGLTTPGLMFAAFTIWTKKSEASCIYIVHQTSNSGRAFTYIFTHKKNPSSWFGGYKHICIIWSHKREKDKCPRRYAAKTAHGGEVRHGATWGSCCPHLGIISMKP